MEERYGSGADREREQQRDFRGEKSEHHPNERARFDERSMHDDDPRRYDRGQGASRRYAFENRNPWSPSDQGRYQTGEGHRYGAGEEDYDRYAQDWGNPSSQRARYAPPTGRSGWDARGYYGGQHQYGYPEQNQLDYGRSPHMRRRGTWDDHSAPYEVFEDRDLDARGRFESQQPSRQQSAFARGAYAHEHEQGYREHGGYGQQGYGGGYAGSSGNRGRPPKGYTRSDERLREDICERLTHHPYADASDVSVQVKDGNVTLEGTVPERSMKHAIEDLAESCTGVNDVTNRIRVDRSHAQSDSSSISATTSQGKNRKNEER